MREKGKRLISLAMALLMAVSGIGATPVSAAAGGSGYEEEIMPEKADTADMAAETGTDEEATGVAGETEIPVMETGAEPVYYTVLLPYYEGCSYTFEKERQLIAATESKDIVMQYEAGEKTELSIETAGLKQITELHIRDYEDKDNTDSGIAYELTGSPEEGYDLKFTMPAKDVWLDLILDETETEKKQTEAAPEDTERPDTLPEEVPEETEIPKETEQPDLPQEETQQETVLSDTEAETDADGLPKQGSIVQAGAVTIPYDTWDFDMYHDFRGMNYDGEDFAIEFVSDNIIYDVPGIYDCIYRVKDMQSGKFWFVLRPVIVAEETAVDPEAAEVPETEKPEELETPAETEEFEETEAPAGTEIPATETETEYGSDAETETETETESGAETKTETDSETSAETETETGTETESIIVYEADEPISLLSLDVGDIEKISTNLWAGSTPYYNYPTSMVTGGASLGTAYKTSTVTYKDGRSCKFETFCLQSELLSPQSGFSKREILDGNSKYDTLTKALYMFSNGDLKVTGDELWGQTLTDKSGNAINLKTYFEENGVKTKKAQYAMQHAVLSYLYKEAVGGSWSWNAGCDSAGNTYTDVLNSKGKTFVKNVANIVENYDFPDADLSPASIGNSDVTYSGGMFFTPEMTYTSYKENALTLNVGNGVYVYAGDTNLGSGSVRIPGGTTFRLAADPAQASGLQTYTGKATYFSAGQAIKRVSADPGCQDVGFVALVNSADFTLSVEWPSYSYIEIQKYDKETGMEKPQNSAVSFEGAKYGIYTDEGCSNLIEMLTTDKNGYAKSGGLVYGTYYVRETDPPIGYTADKTIYPVELDKKGGSVYCVRSGEQIIRGSISLMKFFEEGVSGSKLQEWIDKGYLQGIRFTLRHEDPSVAQPEAIVTDRFGYAATAPNALVYGTWYIDEDPDTTPNGFRPIFDAAVKVTEDGVELKYVAENDGPDEYYKIIKKDAVTGNVLAGARFQILDAQGVAIVMPDDKNFGKLTDTFTTGEDGTIMLTRSLKAGDYTLKEVEAPKGYLLAEPQPFTVTADNEGTYDNPLVVECLDEPQTGKIRIRKTDADGGQLGAGFVFEIAAAKDIKDGGGHIRSMEIDGVQKELTAGTVIAQATTGEDGIAEIDGLYVGEYVIRETAAAEHYAVNDTEYPVTLADEQDAAVALAEVTVTDEKTQFDLYKVDSESDPEKDIPLEGISFRIFTTKGLEDETEAQVAAVIEKLQNAGAEDLPAVAELLKELTELFGLGEVYTTDTEGHIHLTDLKHDAVYYIYETATLPGYNLDTGVYQFKVDEKGLIDGSSSYTMKITNTANLLDVSKTDITGEKELAGATLQIKDAEGKLIEEWVSEETEHRIKGLPAGTYTLTETQAPQGYAVAQDITFILTDSMEIQQVVMKDELLVVSVQKVDESGENAVTGAHLAIFNAAGESVADWTTDGNPYEINLPAGKYRLEELEAPEKFAKAEPIEFEISSDKASYNIVMYDKLIQAAISKQDITNNTELPGAKLILKTIDGELIDEWISGNEPHMLNLAAGKYVLLEESAPEGYELAEKVEFEITDSMEVQTVTMYDEPKEKTIDLTGKKHEEKKNTGSGSTPGTTVTAGNVKTGDIDRYLPAIMAIVIGAFGAAAAAVIRRKKKD